MISPKISVVLPFYNESENIEKLCSTIDDYAKQQDFEIEFVFVDDGSQDDSSERFVRYEFKHIQAKLVTLSKNFGGHAALRAGVTKVTGEYCMFFSADLQEPVEMIGQLYNEIKKGYDVVYARRAKKASGKGAGFFSNMTEKLLRRYVVKDLPEGGINNMLFNRKIIDQLNHCIENNSSIQLQIISMGFKHTLIDIEYAERERGHSKWTFSKKVKLFIDSFVSFSYLPIRLVTIVGLVFALIGIVWSIALFTIKIFDLIPLAAGWPTTIAIMLFGFGVTNITLGIIAEYLWRAFDAARNRPTFIIDQEIDMTQKKDDGEQE